MINFSKKIQISVALAATLLTTSAYAADVNFEDVQILSITHFTDSHSFNGVTSLELSGSLKCNNRTDVALDTRNGANEGSAKIALAAKLAGKSVKVQVNDTLLASRCTVKFVKLLD